MLILARDKEFFSTIAKMLASSLLVVVAQVYLANYSRVSAFHVPTTLLSRRNPLRTSAVIMKVDLSPAKSAMSTVRSELGRTLNIMLDASIQRKLVVIAHPLIMFLLYLIATSKLTKNAANSISQNFRKLIDLVKSKFKKSQRDSVLAVSLAKSAESISLPAAHIASFENTIVLPSRSVQEDAKSKAAKLIAFDAQEVAIMKSQIAVKDAKAKASEVEEKTVGSNSADSASFGEFSGKYGGEFIIQEAKLLTPTESDVADRQKVASRTAADQLAKDAAVRAETVKVAAAAEVYQLIVMWHVPLKTLTCLHVSMCIGSEGCCGCCCCCRCIGC